MSTKHSSTKYSNVKKFANHRNEARLLGTPRPKPAHKAKAAAERPKATAAAERPKAASAAPQESAAGVQKGIDTPQAHAIQSTQMENAAIPPPTPDARITRSTVMTVTLKGLTKPGTQAIYVGARTSLYVPLVNFPDKVAPATLEVHGLLGAEAKEARPKMTAEERKAARAAKPKPTLAEKAAAAQKRADALRAQAEKDAQHASL